jgi:methionyl-tRNA synthetase
LNLVNNNFQEKPKTEKMELITNHLNLNVDSNESAVLNAIKENETLSKEILETEENAHKETKETLEAVQNELTELKSVAIAQTVENAIKDGRIKEEDKEKMLKLATVSPEVFNEIILCVQPSRPKLTDTIENNIEDKDTRKDWTIRDFEKKDPKALVEMIKNDFDGYSELFEATYKVKPSK